MKGERVAGITLWASLLLTSMVHAEPYRTYLDEKGPSDAKTPDESSVVMGTPQATVAATDTRGITTSKRFEIPIAADEFWWGGEVLEGRAQPFSAASAGYDVDMRLRHGRAGGNQAAPVLLSTKGRWIWCEQAFRFAVTNGTLVIDTEKAAPIATGQAKDASLRGAFRACASKYYPAKGTPKLKFFEHPILNTWIEMKYEQSEKGVLEYAKRFVDNGLDAGVFMIDHTWHREPFGCWDFHDGRFHDPKGMVKKMNAMGFTMMLWFDPHISTDTAVYRELKRKGMLLRKPNGDAAESYWWPGKAAILDCTNPKDYAWLKGTLERLMNDYGVEGFFFDAGDAYNYDPAAVPFDKSASPSDQVRAFHMIGMDVPYQQHRASWKMGGLPLMQTLRDKHPTYAELLACIRDGLCAGLIGYPFVVFDLVGGGTVSSFEGENFTAAQDHFIRSLQVQCLSPMIQFSLSPWRVLDARHQQIVRDQMALRRSFAAYITACAVDCGKTGDPMMRSLDFAYPGLGYEQVLDQFLMGEKLLAAPQVYENAASRKVVIPPGTWKADDGAIVTGPTTIEVQTPLARLPHFVNTSKP